MISSKRVKAEPVTPSKSTKSNQSSASKPKDNKSSTSEADIEIIWDSDEEIDYSRIDTDITTGTAEQKRSLRNKKGSSPVPESKSNRGLRNKTRSRSKSPAPECTSKSGRRNQSRSRSKSPAPERTSKSGRRNKSRSRSKSPAPERTSKSGRRNQSRSRSKSPAPRSRSPAQSSRSHSKAEVEVKKEPISPGPKTSPKEVRKGHEKKGKLHMDVKVETEGQGQRQNEQRGSHSDGNIVERQLKVRCIIFLFCLKSVIAVLLHYSVERFQYVWHSISAKFDNWPDCFMFFWIMALELPKIFILEFYGSFKNSFTVH